MKLILWFTFLIACVLAGLMMAPAWQAYISEGRYEFVQRCDQKCGYSHYRIECDYFEIMCKCDCIPLEVSP